MQRYELKRLTLLQKLRVGIELVFCELKNVKKKKMKKSYITNNVWLQGESDQKRERDEK